MVKKLMVHNLCFWDKLQTKHIPDHLSAICQFAESTNGNNIGEFEQCNTWEVFLIVAIYLKLCKASLTCTLACKTPINGYFSFVRKF